VKLNLELFQLAGALLGHTSARQRVIAQNIANADTPNFKARDIQPFSSTYEKITGTSLAMRATRADHFNADPLDFRNSDQVINNAFGAEAPNGNTVSLEDQMMRSAQIKGQHDLALGIYQKSLTILRTAMSKR